MTFTALTDKAPYTTFSFEYLARKKYFDATKCHRLTTSGIYVLQCGDPTGTGSGGPGYQFQDENLTGATYPAGTIAMANAGPGTNGSQFFIVYKDTQLPPSYTPWGKVTAGLDIVQGIAKAGVAAAGRRRPEGHRHHQERGHQGGMTARRSGPAARRGAPDAATAASGGAPRRAVTGVT